MTRPSLITWLLVCLLASAGCTKDQPQQTPPRTEPRHYCPLVPCSLPARQPLLVNDDWRAAIDALEVELLACATQVQDCIGRQRIQQTRE